MFEKEDQRCCLSGRRQPRAQMLRLVLSPEASLVLDLQEKLADDAIWVEASRTLIFEAICDGRFARSVFEVFGQKINFEMVDDFLPGIEKVLLSRCLGRLGLAKKAGQFVTGFERVNESLGKNNQSIFFLASDASHNARKKIQKNTEARQGLNVIEVLSGNELGSAVGRERVVFALLKKTFAGEAFYDEVLRLGHFRGKAVPCADLRGQKDASEAGNLSHIEIGAGA